MRLIADLHIHSKYARACSPLLTPENIAYWCEKKGIGVVGTGDITHPKWFSELSVAVEETRPGLYQLRSRKNAETKSDRGLRQEVYFLCQGEISSIYKQGDRVRRQHTLVFLPSLEIAEKFNRALSSFGANLSSDGRPITGIHLPDLVKLGKDVDGQIEFVPAHVWTPHFGLFGSLSGFSSIAEAFGDQAEHIFAVETGLSSDPPMNWQVPDLDNLTLISNSDPHSLHRLGREANELEIAEAKLSYGEIIRIFKNRNPKEFLRTIEFFPEEGRYHLDGHDKCNFSCLPAETTRLHGICPVCGKLLLRGTLSRVAELSGQYRESPVAERSNQFVYAVPLAELIGEVLGVGPQSKKVEAKYQNMLEAHSELWWLLEAGLEELEKFGGKLLAESVKRMREGRVIKTSGFDGRYGVVRIFSAEELLLLRQQQAPQLF